MKASRRGEWLVTLPSFGWLLVFFLVPTLIVVAFAFKPSDPFGGVSPGWRPKPWKIVWRPMNCGTGFPLSCRSEHGLNSYL